EMDTARRLHADVLSTALGGAAGAREALRQLRLDGLPVVVCALAVAHPAGTAATVDAEVRLLIERQKLSDGFAMHLSSVHPAASPACSAMWRTAWCRSTAVAGRPTWRTRTGQRVRSGSCASPTTSSPASASERRR